LSIEKYHFGHQEIDLPAQGVQLMRCKGCTLHFKTYIPTKSALADLFRMTAADVWVGKQLSYQHEIELLKRFLPSEPEATSLLDVGSSDGAFLRTVKPLAEVRSACDVYVDPRCEQYANGEYIQAFIEDPELQSRLKYDLISMFDVLEHLYSPNQAFKNIVRLGKPSSLVILETGDISKIDRPASWWYVNYIEHHVFWTRHSLQTLADTHGYKLVHFENLPHKGRRYMPPAKRLLARGLHALRKIDLLRKVVLACTKLRIEMIGDPYELDHMLALLQRDISPVQIEPISAARSYAEGHAPGHAP
jgi:SAM-dependent methyltransferase